MARVAALPCAVVLTLSLAAPAARGQVATPPSPSPPPSSPSPPAPPPSPPAPPPSSPSPPASQPSQPTPPAPPPDARPLTLAQAVSLAIEHNPDVLTGRAQVDEAGAAQSEVGGAFGPKLHVDANAQRWTSPYQIGLGPGQTFTVRDVFTWTASVSIIQPITPLVTIYDQYKVAELGVDVAKIRHEETRRTTALGAISAYYRLLEAGRLAGVAAASVTQLEAQEKQAQSLFSNGVIGRNDLLRAGLALATARQRLIQSRGQIEVARGQLAVALGVPDSEPLEPVPFEGEPPPSSESALQEAEAHAVSRRIELQELDRRIAQADSGVAYARSKYLPQVNAVGNYTHTEGSPFSPVDAAYAGLVASWDVWDWGTTSAGVGQAKAKLEQARLARRKAEDQLRLEARRAFVESRTAREGLSVARVSVTQAEENYRIVSKRFENAAATSFDVVDAEEQLTQARGQVESALYDLLIAEAALDEATGAALPGER